MSGGAGARDLWIFAYGSLMWRPGFAYEEAARATLAGYRRCFCIYSVHHRGTPRRPGLVLGLDRGGSCEGLAFRVPACDAGAVLAYLRAREQVTAVYREALLPVSLRDRGGAHVLAVAYIVERKHPAYAGRLPLALEAWRIRAARGRSGANLDYFASTLAHLGALGVRERSLERLAAVIGGFTARGRRENGSSPRVLGLAGGYARTPLGTPRFKADGLNPFGYRARVPGLDSTAPRS